MYYGWNIVAVGVVFQAVTYGMTLFVFTFWSEAWMNEFGTERAEVTTIFMLYNLCLGLSSAILGRILDRYSIRLLICAGALFIATGFLLISLAAALWQITAVYMLLIAPGCVLAGPLAAQTLAAKWFRRRRGLALGWGSTGTSIGGLLMPPIVIFMILDIGWRAAHQVLALAALLVIVPVVLKVIHNTPAAKGVEPEAAGPEEADAGLPGEAVFWTTGKVLRNSTFWITIIAFLPAVAAFSTMQANLRLYTVDIGIDPQRSAFLMSLIAGAMIAGKLFFGGLADRIDHRFLYWCSALTFVLSMLLLIGRPSYTVVTIVCGLLGFAAGGFLPLLGVIVSSRFGANAYGQVFGMMSPFLTMSSFAPAMAGWVRDTTGSYDPIFQTIAVILIPAMAAMWFLPSPGSLKPGA